MYYSCILEKTICMEYFAGTCGKELVVHKMEMTISNGKLGWAWRQVLVFCWFITCEGNTFILFHNEELHKKYIEDDMSKTVPVKISHSFVPYHIPSTLG